MYPDNDYQFSDRFCWDEESGDTNLWYGFQSRTLNKDNGRNDTSNVLDWFIYNNCNASNDSF